MNEKNLKAIEEIAGAVGLRSQDLLHYGPYKAKISLGAIKRIMKQPAGKLILVSAITPTPPAKAKPPPASALPRACGTSARTRW
jgi:formate--tetrahydrofolate ligase